MAVFVKAPSIEVMEHRLRTRGTDQEEKIKERIAKAKREVEFAKDFDLILINEDLETAKKEATTLVRKFVSAK